MTILDCALSSVFSLIPFVQIELSDANLTESHLKFKFLSDIIVVFYSGLVSRLVSQRHKIR